MGIERNEIEPSAETTETPEQKVEREFREQEDQLNLAREAQHKAELEAAQAKGEAEAMRRGMGQAPAPAQTAVTEEQWQAMENQSGMTRQQIQANAQMFGSMFQQAARPLQEKLEASEKEIREAREEAKRAKAATGLYAIEKDFYDKNPGLSSRRGDMEEFLSMLPDESRSDPKKYSVALEKAKTYAIGKARENIATQRGGKKQVGTERPTPVDESVENISNEAELDVSDLDNEGSRRLVESIYKNPGPEKLALSKEKPLRLINDRDELLKRTARSDGRGVSIDERVEWMHGENINTRPSERLRDI